MMEFDWTTFILEIVNFLVLVWILQRFLYRPMLNMLDARQQRLKDEAEHAEQLRDEAEALRQEYELRLADWERQQEAGRHALDEELAQLRRSALETLQKTLVDEDSKWRIRNQSLAETREATLIREAAGAAYGQVATLLQRLASPQLTRSIVDIFLEDLRDLPESDQTVLNKAAAMLIAASAAEIISAHPLPEALKITLNQALSQAAGQHLPLGFRVDAGLIAGIRVVVGECQLHANLADELAYFRRQTHHD